MLIAASLMAMVQAAPEPSMPEPFDSNAYYETWSRKEMRAQIKDCGFEEVKVYKNKAKATVVKVDDTSATDRQLQCAADRIDRTFYYYEFSPELAERFAVFKEAVARPRQIAQARARFAKEPERGVPPERMAGESDAALADRIEAFCGPQANGALDTQLTVPGAAAVSPEWMARFQNSIDGITEMAEAMGCVMQAATIADLKVGFLGNDVADEPAE